MKYRVMVTRKVVQAVTVEIEADRWDAAAENKAITEANEIDHGDWAWDVDAVDVELVGERE